MSHLGNLTIEQLEQQYRVLEQRWRSLDAQLRPLMRELARVEALTEEIKWELIRQKDRQVGEGGDAHDRTTA
ncbi:hypothetical protein LOK74_08235 [Brevibacillus humidisoli]|uniref:hypothetical protein n=1 Tax=Brevibacillus humidisoli TaxID=2895522 RepID=UPI001E4B02DB|nr:hypothetical protein [Brevibacillus humidisoli]UFJ42462.1 hypothetical protein LOK74_08235 [Brevibacillus humidisoli]